MTQHTKTYWEFLEAWKTWAWSIVFLEKFIDKYNDFFPPIVQHTHTHDSTLSFLRPVCLPAVLSSYVLVHLSWAATHLSEEFYHTTGSTVNGHDSKSLRTVSGIFFVVVHPAQSSMWWLLFETWLPLLQGQWRVGFSRSSSILSVLHSERCNHWVNGFFSTDRAWRQISPSRNVTSWTGLMSAKINAHAGKCTHFFRLKERLYCTPKTAHWRKHMHVCTCIPVPGQPLKFNLM